MYRNKTAVYKEKHIINGGGTFKEDTFAQLSAAPLEGNTFVGWFENDELVSSNPTYRFRVESDRTITAKFEGEPIDRTINHLFSLVTPGGSASMEEEPKMFYQKGDTVTLKAEANEGMKFVRWEAENGVFADASSPETVFTMPDCDILVIAVFESENPEPQTTDTTAVTETTTSETTAQTTAVKGDVNCDGELTVADAVFLCRVIAEDTSVVISENGKVNADVNGDGTITTDDTTIIVKALAGLLSL